MFLITAYSVFDVLLLLRKGIETEERGGKGVEEGKGGNGRMGRVGKGIPQLQFLDPPVF